MIQRPEIHMLLVALSIHHSFFPLTMPSPLSHPFLINLSSSQPSFPSLCAFIVITGLMVHLLFLKFIPEEGKARVEGEHDRGCTRD